MSEEGPIRYWEVCEYVPDELLEKCTRVKPEGTDKILIVPYSEPLPLTDDEYWTVYPLDGDSYLLHMHVR